MTLKTNPQHEERPLDLSGSKRREPAPKPAEVWKKTETPGIEVNGKGQLKTSSPRTDWAGTTA